MRIHWTPEGREVKLGLNVCLYPLFRFILMKEKKSYYFRIRKESPHLILRSYEHGIDQQLP